MKRRHVTKLSVIRLSLITDVPHIDSAASTAFAGTFTLAHRCSTAYVWLSILVHFVCMSLSPLPSCSRSVDRSQPDREWNEDHKHWIPDTVWAAQYSARGAQKSGTEPEGLYRCAACAADFKTPEKPKCSKCKLVSSGCPVPC